MQPLLISRGDRLIFAREIRNNFVHELDAQACARETEIITPRRIRLNVQGEKNIDQ